MTLPSAQTRVEVKSCSPTELMVAIIDRQPEIAQQFHQLAPAEREQLAANAWSIGLRAALGALSAAHQARLSEVGAQMIKDVESQLSHRLAQHEQSVEAALRRYFDPTTGALSQRLDELVKDGGELSQLLGQYVEGDTSALAQSLASSVGANSPLGRQLSADDSSSVVQLIRAKVEQALAIHNVQVTRALDPRDPEGPVSLFLQSLKALMAANDNDREAQLKGALKALDANDPASLLSNLSRQSKETGEALLKALNPANPDSPLTALNTTLSQQLDRQFRASQLFEKQMLEAVARLEARRAERATSTHGGGDFQKIVAERVRRITSGGPYSVDFVGDNIGAKGRCKVGDVLVRFTEESKYAGAALVIECKRRQRTSRADAVAELKVARENRAAGLGLFVCSAEYAGADFPELARVGTDVLVTWNPEDASSDVRLDAAIMLALCLATRRAAAPTGAQAKTLERLVDSLQLQVDALGRLGKSGKTLCTASEAVRKEVETMTGQLEGAMALTREALCAVAGAASAVDEAATPIMFPADATADAA